MSNDTDTKEVDQNYYTDCGYLLHKSCRIVAVQGMSKRQWQNQYDAKNSGPPEKGGKS